jgi:hypothetical protein
MTALRGSCPPLSPITAPSKFQPQPYYISVMYTPYGVLRKNACSHRMSASRLISNTRPSTLATGSFHRMWPRSCSVANTCSSHNGRTLSFLPLSAAFPTSSNIPRSNPPTYDLSLQYPSSWEVFPRELCDCVGGCDSRCDGAFPWREAGLEGALGGVGSRVTVPAGSIYMSAH